MRILFTHSHLEETFRKFGPSQQVQFLEDRGARFDPECLPLLFEETFRSFGPSTRLQFLEDRGAQFDPQTLSSLFVETFRTFGPASPRVRFLEHRGARFDPKSLSLLFEDTFRRRGPSPRVQFLEDRGAQFDPERLPLLFEEVFRKHGPASPRVRFLEDRGAQFNPERLPLFFEDTFCKFGPSLAVQILLERMLANFEMQGDYAEAWDLALKSYRHYLPANSCARPGLIQVFYNLIDQASCEVSEENVKMNHARRSVLSTSVKLYLISQLDDSSQPKVLADRFRQWLSASLEHDSGSHVVWIKLQKGSTNIRIQREVLTFWCRYFSAKFSGRWPFTSECCFDGYDEIKEQSFRKIFGGFCTTGIYEWTSQEDLGYDYQLADYFQIKRLERILEGLGERES